MSSLINMYLKAQFSTISFSYMSTCVISHIFTFFNCLKSVLLNWKSILGLISCSGPQFIVESSINFTELLNWQYKVPSTGNGTLPPVLLPGESHGWRSLVGCSPWGPTESDRAEWLHFDFSLSCIGEGSGNPLQCSCLENPRDGGEPGGLPSMGSHRVGRDWSNLAAAAAASTVLDTYWRFLNGWVLSPTSL